MVPAGSDSGLEAIRVRLIAMLDAAEYRITGRALRDGHQILRDWGLTPTEWGIVEFVLGRLRAGHPIREAPQGDPPGCHGVAYELKNADPLGLYVKLMIDERSFDQTLVVVISFHY